VVKQVCGSDEAFERMPDSIVSVVKNPYTTYMNCINHQRAVKGMTALVHKIG
jgi:hypothetical protein